MEPREHVRIGVLALQGAIALHWPHIEALGAEYTEVTTGEHLARVDGLILPGGESGVMLKLLLLAGMDGPLREFLLERPAWGICAGAILMARAVRNPEQPAFGALDIEIERNAYGRQLESSEESIDGYAVSYIRAPRIVHTGPTVEVLSRRDGFPTWVEAGYSMVTTFHPEVNRRAPSPWHLRFVERCQSLMIR